jgi:hypothetical protein
MVKDIKKLELDIASLEHNLDLIASALTYVTY